MKRTRNEIASANLPADTSARPTVSQLERYLDFTVVDRDNNKIGTMDAIWEDHTGQPSYLGIKTGWLGLGRTHVIPVASADVSENTRKIRLPYSMEVVKNAPAFEEQSDINPMAEEQIDAYYRQHGFHGTAANTATAPVDQPGTTGTAGPRGTRTALDERDEIRMPVSEEQVEIGKRQVEVGGVRLRKIVRTERVNQPIDLQREEIVVERVPAKDRTPNRTDVAFREEEVYVPLRREEPVINKRTEVKEEVRVSKKRDLEHRDVSETVRREDVEVDRTDEGSRSGQQPPM